MKFEIIKENEIEETCLMIERACRCSSLANFYPKEYVEGVIKNQNYDFIKRRMTWTHFYVLKDDDKIIGCGAIGPYWDSLTESCLFTIFVDPDYQGKRYGSKILEGLEKDEYGLRAKTIYVHSAMSAIPFYKKNGYNHKNGQLNYQDGHFELEKHFTKVINK